MIGAFRVKQCNQDNFQNVQNIFFRKKDSWFAFFHFISITFGYREKF